MFMRSITTFLKPARSILFFLWFLFLISETVFCQPVIRGKIIGRDGIILPGATVRINGTNNFTTSDSAGYFTLRASPANVIIISFIGYREWQIVLKNETVLNISLTQGILILDEIEMIGYGMAKEKDLTGAVGSVAEKDFNKGIISSPDQLIQGKVSGAQMTTNNGLPGGAITVKISGNSALNNR